MKFKLQDVLQIRISKFKLDKVQWNLYVGKLVLKRTKDIFQVLEVDQIVITVEVY